MFSLLITGISRLFLHLLSDAFGPGPRFQHERALPAMAVDKQPRARRRPIRKGPCLDCLLVKYRPRALWQALTRELPRLGQAGSRSAHLHQAAEEELPLTPDLPLVVSATGVDVLDVAHREAPAAGSGEPQVKQLSFTQLRRFAFLRWAGTLGALLLGLGGLGGGALPVVNNPYGMAPLGSIMGRMLQTSMMLCFLGVGLLVVAWLGMSAFCGVVFRHQRGVEAVVSLSMLRRTFLAWTLPILLSAPMFTQDIYSYLANGKILRLGLDPYSGGPIDLLGTDDPLARSVPFIWAHSSSPYGPVSLGIAELISAATNDHIAFGVIAHRLVSIVGVALAGWAMVRLARRCRIHPQAAVWLGILNPLTLLHLVAGIHNESIMLGLALAGFELGLMGCDRIRMELHRSGFALVAASGFLISCAGMVKVSGFIGLGFIGVVLARSLHARGTRRLWSLSAAVAMQVAVLVASIGVVTLLTGIGLGWVTGQGGAATIRSWMSLSTAVGVIAGWWSMVLGLGDYTDSILSFTRMVGVGIAVAFMLRMLLATFSGRINAIGALGVSTLVLVIFFPVVHPWYILWAVFPLAPWANRIVFRLAVVVYSVFVSFMVLPRGMGLPPGTIFSVYLGSILSFIALIAIALWILRRRGVMS